MWKRRASFRNAFVPLEEPSGKPAGTLKPDRVIMKQRTGTSLRANITVKGHFIKAFPWTIDKAVTPPSLHISAGGTGSALYLITVSKGFAADSAFIKGQVCVTNSGAVATADLKIIGNLTMPPSSKIIASVQVDTSGGPILASGESRSYDYRLDIPSGSIVPNGVYKISFNVNISNHSGHLGSPFGPSPGATTILPATQTLINDTIHLDDTNGGSFTFGSSGSQEYMKVFNCDDAGTNISTATIRETGQQASAGVMVICGSPTIVKETVCVQANVKITPNIEVGNIELFCVGNPIIGGCGGAPAGECSFMVSQNICIQIPLAFSVDAEASQAGIVCGQPAVEPCGADNGD